jgi:hypothetical protein
MQIIPLQALPSQSLTIVLDGQSVIITIYQKSTGMYMDCVLNTSIIFTTFRVLTGVNVIQQTYYGFSGGLVMIDNQGDEDPDYTGLGSRWQLVYLSETEVK